ncbi:hypothetical protein B0J14DRAFT_503509, partial [Halenospora varia]
MPSQLNQGQGPPSSAAAKAPSLLKTDYDQKMASKQINYHTLQGNEKIEQDRWVRNYMDAAGTCPMGVRWIRHGAGYLCAGKNHYVSDQLIAEGRAG